VHTIKKLEPLGFAVLANSKVSERKKIKKNFKIKNIFLSHNFFGKRTPREKNSWCL